MKTSVFTIAQHTLSKWIDAHLISPITHAYEYGDAAMHDRLFVIKLKKLLTLSADASSLDITTNFCIRTTIKCLQFSEQSYFECSKK